MNSLVVLVLTFATALALPSNLIIPAGQPEGRITRGHDANVGQFPYQVILFIKRTDLKTYLCGGSILNNEWVLTAAHCTWDLVEAKVVLGTTNPDRAGKILIVTPKDVIDHEGYNHNAHTKEHDIALIRIPHTEYTPNIQPVKLPSMSGSYSDYIGDNVIASGYGNIDDDGNRPKTLQWANLTIIPNGVCQEHFIVKIQPSFMCTDTNNGINICGGDSGGPIVLASSKVQIGLTSFGAKSCLESVPSVFTRLTSYLYWIKTYTGVSY